MFDILAKLLSSMASFLFPLFASYKALKTSDPAELTPWLMYWVVLACVLLVESWTEWFLVWFPFYAWIRLLFLLYLVLPQTQGARVLYQIHVHPWLEENENAIEHMITSFHERARSAGVAYLRKLVDFLKTNLLGLAPSAASSPPPPTTASHPQTTQSYTQTLLARFSLPSARWPGPQDASAAGAGDVYNLLSTAVGAAARSAAASSLSSGVRGVPDAKVVVVPESIRGTTARMSFISAQRERLNAVLSALDREASQLQAEEAERAMARPSSMSLDGGAGDRPPSGLSRRSRSEADFEKLEAESGTEDMDGDARPTSVPAPASAWGWMAWGWPRSQTDHGSSTSADRQ